MNENFWDGFMGGNILLVNLFIIKIGFIKVFEFYRV